MSHVIKPIQTRYSGCHFRSRLEARWAVFFNELGIHWEYEPEGFQLTDGSTYLPDFKLTPNAIGWPVVYVEVKPFDSLSKIQADKLFRFFEEMSKVDKRTCLWVCKGLPSDEETICLHSSTDSKIGPMVTPLGSTGPHELTTFAGFVGLIAKVSKERVLKSAIAAKSARFEHGESGVV